MLKAPCIITCVPNLLGSHNPSNVSMNAFNVTNPFNVSTNPIPNAGDHLSAHVCTASPTGSLRGLSSLATSSRSDLEHSLSPFLRTMWLIQASTTSLLFCLRLCLEPWLQARREPLLPTTPRPGCRPIGSLPSSIASLQPACTALKRARHLYVLTCSWNV